MFQQICMKHFMLVTKKLLSRSRFLKNQIELVQLSNYKFSDLCGKK